MVTKKEYQNEILCSISELWNICTSCGECCKNQSIPLHPFELSHIVHLFDDEDQFRLFIQRNPYPFNIQTEYYFKFDSVCPFLESNQCSIYSKRPLVCRLFPIRLEAFFDSSLGSFREPLFQIVSGESHLPCMIDNIMLFQRLKMRVVNWGKSGDKIIDYIVSTIVDELNFVYLFGQEPRRDAQAFSPNLSEIKSEGEFASILLDGLYNCYHVPSLYTVEAHERLVPLNDDEVHNLLDRRYLMNNVQEISRLLKRMEKKKHPILQWRKNIF